MRLRNNYFLLRHGQTIYQTKKRKLIYPWPEKNPVKLTKKGREMARRAAKKLKNQKIDFIFSSDVFRARQTAEISAKELEIKKIKFDKRLRDINLGIYRGGLKEEYYKEFPKNSKKRFYLKPKRGESWLDCQKRAMDFLKETEKAHKNKTILIVSHADPLWLLQGGVKNFSQEKLLDEKENNYIKVGELRKL